MKKIVNSFQKDTHMELTSRVEALEHELEIKDNLIIELQDELIFKVSKLSESRPSPSFHSPTESSPQNRNFEKTWCLSPLLTVAASESDFGRFVLMVFCASHYQEKEFRHQRLGPNFIEDVCSLSETSFESDDEENAFLLAATVRMRRNDCVLL